MKGCTRPFAHGRLDATSVGEFPIGTAPVQRNNHPMGVLPLSWVIRV
jgi:hypothetical protein